MDVGEYFSVLNFYHMMQKFKTSDCKAKCPASEPNEEKIVVNTVVKSSVKDLYMVRT